MYETIIVEKNDKIATIFLNRPEKLNAMNFTMKKELASVVQELEKDDSVAVVIVTGKGRGFCAGADLSETMGKKVFANDGRQRMRNGFPLYKTVANSDKIYIAAINGAASGSGLSLACWCDFRIASENAKLGMPFVDIGLLPDGGLLYTLPRLIGVAKTKELAMQAEKIDAGKALELGLLTKVVKAEELEIKVKEFAEKVASKSYIALALTKNLLNRTFELASDNLLEMEASAQDICFSSEYHNSAITSILEKKK